MNWKRISDGTWPANKTIIVTDGVYRGPGLFAPGENVWIDCDGIEPTHWMSYDELPEIEDADEEEVSA